MSRGKSEGERRRRRAEILGKSVTRKPFLPSFRWTSKGFPHSFGERTRRDTLSPPTLNPIFVQEYRLELARGRRISDDLPIFRPLSLSLSADKPGALSRPAISALTTRIFSNSFQTRRESLVAVESRRALEQPDARDAIYRPLRALLDKRARNAARFVFACRRENRRDSLYLSRLSPPLFSSFLSFYSKSDG